MCKCTPEAPNGAKCPCSKIDWTKPIEAVYLNHDSFSVSDIRILCVDRVTDDKYRLPVLFLFKRGANTVEELGHASLQGETTHGWFSLRNVPPPKKRVYVVVYQWTGLSSGPTVCTTRFFSDAQGNINGFDEMGKTQLHYDTGDRKILSAVIVEYDA